MVCKTPARIEDGVELYGLLQPIQVKELRASHGPCVQETITTCIGRSEEAVAIRQDQKLLGVTGIVSHSITGGAGSPWLLTTIHAPSYPKTVMKETRYYVNKWSEDYDLLISFIDSRYEKALRWAEWAGFTIHPPVPYGINGELFNPIEIRR